MRFARAIWKLLVGIKDALVLVFMLMFFGLLYVTLSVRPAPVGEGVLALNLDGTIVEQASKPSVTELATGTGDMTKQYELRDLVAAVDAARTDDRVKAIALNLDGFLGGGQVAISDLSDALRRFKASGKPVVAYAIGYTDDSYQLASAASEIWLNPLGAVGLAGPGGTQLFYKGLMDKLGITANIYRVGTYKAAVEPFMRSDMSPAAKENALALDGALLSTWRDDVMRARPKAKVDAYMRDPTAAIAGGGGDFAKAALAYGLVDKVGDRHAFDERMAKLGGEDKDAIDGFRKIDLKSYVADAVDKHPSGSIGVVTVAGMIVDGHASAGTAGGDSIAESIEKALRSDSLKALVVRVDSPGGSVLASERIRQAILQAKTKGLPIVVSMGNVAASGGYWVSTPGDFVYAEPGTITGSIGVFGILPSFEGTLQKLGVGTDGVKTTPLSGEPNLLKGPSPEADALLQAGVDSIYGRFVGIVAEARHKSPAYIDGIAQGRVWDGGTARQIGLVDGFGGMQDAIDKAGDLAKLGKNERTVRYLERPVSFRESVVAMLAGDEGQDEGNADAFAMFAGSKRQLSTALWRANQVLSGPTIQAQCLECPLDAATPKAASDFGLLGLIRNWLG
jgi:protease-4